MVHNNSDKAADGRNDHNAAIVSKQNRPTPSQKAKDSTTGKLKLDGTELKDYKLGECLGKGAFGAVYRALNWGTGETVAIKSIKVANVPKNELRTIMLEIDLLKNLKHPNIVKYHGFVKGVDSLYLILEYCENGSLHSICKNFGKFPENLVAIYMSQVLNGLLYLHEQGVIHRDIKGANILTTKEGLVKLADFGVATKTSGIHESTVVGTPYWMAPEVIELSGATTASDIWSLGCTVIELLDGKPPYHKLQPMPALFRIVNDDHPPLPETASPAVQDFLMQCFQKDPNLRVSAKKLLKHPWIANGKRIVAVDPVKPTEYHEAVKSVQQWNEALKSPEATLRRDSRGGSASPSNQAATLGKHVSAPTSNKINVDPTSPLKKSFNTQISNGHKSGSNENWDDDFASSINSNALQLPHLRPVDYFSGALAADKLKAYATYGEDEFDSFLSEDGIGLSNDGSSEVLRTADPLETVRPVSPAKSKSLAAKQDQPSKVTERVPSQPKTQILRPLEKQVATSKRLQIPKRSSSVFREDSSEDYSDLIIKDDGQVPLDQKFREILKSKQSEASSPKFTHMTDLKKSPRSAMKHASAGGSLREKTKTSSDKSSESIMKRSQSSVEIQKYADKVEDQDYSDIFSSDTTIWTKPDSESGSERGKMSMLNSKFSSNSWLGDEEDEDDPFAQLEEDLDEMDLETKVARDKHARLCTLVEGLVGSLKISQPEEILADITEQLLHVLDESSDMKSVIISSHGLLPILEVLENSQRRDICLSLLKIINIIVLDSVEISENFCFVGGIPVVTKFAQKKYSSEIRLEAAAFVRQMCQTSTLTLQMFISCGGLNVLVEFLEEDYEAERDLVLIGVNGVWSVFELQGPTPKNDFCRIFSRSSVLYPLSLVLNRVLDEEGELASLVEGRIANIFLLFSHAENHVKESVADRMVLKRVLKDLGRMTSTHQITMLKFIKNLSMLAATLDALQNSNAIEVLTDLLNSNLKAPHSQEMSNQVLNILFNLCRLSKTRQEDAALNGVIPLLQRVVKTERPLKEFALPILCDMAHSGHVGRKMLWQNKGLQFYITLLRDQYWQVTALDAIFVWLQEETAKVEEHLLHGSFRDAIVGCFTSSDPGPFENLLEPLQKLLRLSPPVAATLAHAELFARTCQKLRTRKPIVRGNLLRIIRSICDACDEPAAMLRKHGLYVVVERLADHDPAILVRNMASDLIRTSETNMRNSFDGARYRGVRRTSSPLMTPPALHSSSSHSPTAQHRIPLHSSQTSGYFDLVAEYNSPRQRPGTLNGSAYRPVSRDGSKLASDGSTSSTTTAAVTPKSRLPRTNVSRAARPSLSSSPRKEDSVTPSAAAHQPPRSTLVITPRRRRQTSAE